MEKFRFSLVVLLLGCVVFVSCERASQMLDPVTPEMDTMDPPDKMDTMDPPDMTGTDPTMDADKMAEMVEMMGSPIVINELMADNDNTVPDPQGDYDDWLELYNRTDSPISLSGMYLSDDEEEPTKWQFPENTEIPANGYLIVWLDEDLDAAEGLHADIKLSKNGEMALLVDTDARGNQVLDSVTFGEQETDVAYGRLPNGTGEFQVIVATPGAENRAE